MSQSVCIEFVLLNFRISTFCYIGLISVSLNCQYMYIHIFLLFWLRKLLEFYLLAQAFANLHGKRRRGKFI